MQETTLCFPLIQGLRHKILLGIKKTGDSRGKYLGFGGKVEPGETVVAAALRELREESGLISTQADLHYRGHITFLPFNSRAHVFVVKQWAGEPLETREMIPRWIYIDQVPFEQMWPTDQQWLDPILAGNYVEATVTIKPTGSRTCQVNTIRYLDSRRSYESQSTA